MYFWNIKALKKELVANTLTESQVFAYFLTMLALNVLVYESIPLFPSAEETNIWTMPDTWDRWSSRWAARCSLTE